MTVRKRHDTSPIRPEPRERSLDLARRRRWAPARSVNAVALLGAALITLPAVVAVAQDQAVIEKLVQMNKKALEDYDSLAWDDAKRVLLDAVGVGKKAGLDNHPVIARTYIHLGAVYATGFKDKQRAVQSFSRALDIDPNIQLTKGIANPSVNEAFAEAQRRKGGGGGADESAAAPPAGGASSSKRKRAGAEGGGAASEGGPSPKARYGSDEESGEPDLPVHVNALDCPNADETIVDKPVTVRCAVSPSLPVTSVVLHYRIPGKEQYVELEMTKTPKGWFQAKIPKKAVTGKSLQFYFDGRNASGKTVVANGAETSPNIMLILAEESAGEARRSGGPSASDEENPLEDNQGPYSPRLRLGHVDRSRIGLDTRYGNRKFWIGLGVGTGFGYAKGKGLETAGTSPDATFKMNTADIFGSGGAWAGLGQLAPEVGYQITPDIAISVEGRLQYIHQSPPYDKFAARGALSALARLLFFTKQSQLRFYGAAMAGGGEGFRFVVPVSYTPPGNTNTVSYNDTVKGGPIVAGLGAGVYYEVAKAVSLVAELNGLGGFPTFSMVLDVNVGVQFNFYPSAAPKTGASRVTEEEEPK